MLWERNLIMSKLLTFRIFHFLSYRRTITPGLGNSLAFKAFEFVVVQCMASFVIQFTFFRLESLTTSLDRASVKTTKTEIRLVQWRSGPSSYFNTNELFNFDCSSRNDIGRCNSLSVSFLLFVSSASIVAVTC